MDALSGFSPEISAWFRSEIGEPTAVQRAAWPAIARGSHVLATAPTGSGKTLTAFLWALNQFATGHWSTGRTRVLYVSPLKALNNDIQRNLLSPLDNLRASGAMPAVRVATRSGDTPQSERQRLLRRPPDILITTPESLNLMLTTARGREALSHVETLIIDEVHALADNRRGVSLATAAERLVELCGEGMQRVALSATVEPLARIAQFVAGRDSNTQARPIEILNPAIHKPLELTVRYPEAAELAAEQGEPVWDALADTFREITDANRSTLFFTNSRKLAEKVTLKINAVNTHPGPLAWAHHGSLSREIRSEVEQRLKAGELRAIVATSSLEMGIDIGELDAVVMVQTPPGIANTLQRLGRAGHRVDAVSRGTLFPVHDHDFLEAAVVTRATLERDLEPLTPIHCPLDMLAQCIISCCATETRSADDLFNMLRRADPYADLSRENFDRVLEQLAGRYSGARVRTLEPRIEYDRLTGAIDAKKSAVFAFYNAGGSIPDRGYYQIRHSDGGTQIGELDEEFVWEAKIGDVFSFGTQHWQVQRITHNDVFVKPARPIGIAPPFWRSEKVDRSAHLATRLAAFLSAAEDTLAHQSTATLSERLESEHHFDARSAAKLTTYLQRQRSSTGCALPGHRHVVIEHVQAGPDGYRGPDLQTQWVLHTFWGGRVNRPFALALGAAWRSAFEDTPEIHSDNDALIVLTKARPTPEQVMSLVTAAKLDGLLRQSLEGSGFFGARFREVSGRFLLLPRQRFNQRLPLWMSRLQAKKLLSATRDFDDFPVTLETWRTCLRDEFDLDALRERLTAVGDGSLTWSYVQSQTPSPFARQLSYEQIAPLVYADDTPESDGPSQLSTDLIQAVAQHAELRPALHAQVCAEFVAKRQRSREDYRPDSAPEWRAWTLERVLLPESEWWDGWHGSPASADTRLVEWTIGDRRWVCHLEHARTLRETGLMANAACSRARLPKLTDPRDALTLAVEVLSFYGPLSETHILELLPSVPEGLLTDERLVRDVEIEGDGGHYFVEAQNLEILLRWQRAANRPEFEALPSTQLPAFLARWQAFDKPATTDNLIDALERLRGYRAPVDVLLSDCLDARLRDLPAHLLDATLADTGMQWQGHAKQRISLQYPEDTPLLQPHASTKAPDWLDAFADPAAGYSFNHIRDQIRINGSDQDTQSINAAWWQAVWQGLLVADSLAPLRRGIQNQFQLGAAQTATGRVTHSRRGARTQARAASAGWPGLWRRTVAASPTDDPLAQLDLARDRVHLLLERYGMINRDLAAREAESGNHPLAWRHLFQALRVMELSGEVVQGHFFNDLSGPQFASPQALNHLRQRAAAPSVFWCNALDPVSPCGLGLEWPELPHRRANNLLAFKDGALALVVTSGGKALQVFVEPDDDALPKLLAPLAHLAKRGRIALNTVNGEPAIHSPWLAPIERTLRCHRDHKAVYIETVAGA